MPVVVAARDMPEGVTIDRVAVTVAQWPVGTQPPGAYSNIDSVANRVTRVAVYERRGDCTAAARAGGHRPRARGEDHAGF